MHYVVCFGELRWYNILIAFKDQLVHLYERKKLPVLEMIQHLDEFKLRVEYSHKNELVISRGKTVPRTAGIESSLFPYQNLASLRQRSVNLTNFTSSRLS